MTTSPFTARPWAVSVALACALLPCAAAKAQSVGPRAIIYANDDRREVFEMTDPSVRARIEGGVVALMHKNTFEKGPRVPRNAPTARELSNLCGEERFAEQPALAFCTGVLVDRDLVLTAAHCLNVMDADEMAVVFGYFYDEKGKLAVGPKDIVEVSEVVDQTLASSADPMQLDYAFLRLARPAPANRKPVPIRMAPPEVSSRLVSVGASLGVPLKVDSAALVRKPRAERGDYFVADTDTSGGASGGPAFDESSALLGVLARGGADFEGDPHCATMVNVPAGRVAREEFTYAYSALSALCSHDPSATSLCRASCGDPCAPSATAPTGGGSGAGGCSVSKFSDSRELPGTAFLALLLAVLVRRQRVRAR